MISENRILSGDKSILGVTVLDNDRKKVNIDWQVKSVTSDMIFFFLSFDDADAIS